jgi:hypothetical protein
VTRKQAVAAFVATCTVVAAVIGFVANLATIAEFFGGDARPGTSVNQAPQPVAQPPSDQQPPGQAVPTARQTPAAPRVRPVPEIGDTGIIPQPHERGAVAPEVPAAFHGQWVGLVHQDGVSTPYQVKLVITPGRSADVVASVEYPSLECGGSWVLQNSWEHMIRVTEVIERGKVGCVDEVTIELSTQPDGQLYYEFEVNGGGAGVLRRP